MKHLGAILLAALLIVGAVLVRSHLDDDGADPILPATGATLVCAEELADVCRDLAASTPRLSVRIERVQRTEQILVDAASPSAVDFDAWLVPSVYPAMVADQRSRALAPEILDPPGEVIAESPLVIIGWNDRLERLESACMEVSWTCIGDLSGSAWSDHGGDPSWGAVTPGFASPTAGATGLAVVAQATGSWFGDTDYAANDFADSDYRSWLARLEHGVINRPGAPRTPLDEMLSKGPASFDLTGDTEAAARTRTTGSRSQDDLKILYPAPSVTVDIVLVTVTGSVAGEGLSRLLMSKDASKAFSESGWHLGSGTSGDQLPPAGVLLALRNLWTEISR